MNRTPFLLAVTIGLVVATLTIGGVVAQPNGSAILATGDTHTEFAETTETTTTPLNPVCESDEDKVIGVTVKRTYDDTITLYPGSQLSVVICQEGERLDRNSGTGWNLSEGDIYKIDDTTKDSVRITIRKGGTVDLAERIVNASPNNKLEIRTPSENIYQGSEGGLFNVSIQFQSVTAREAFVENETRYLEANSSIDELNAKLANSRDELSASSDPDDVREHAQHLKNLSSQHTKIKESMTNMQLLLYTEAMNLIQAENTTVAMKQLQNQQEQVEGKTVVSATTSRNELEQVENEIQSSTRKNIGISLLGGLLFGIVVGAIGPYGKGREVDDFYQVSSQNELTKSVLKLPWIIGILLLLGGLGAMIWFGILGVAV